MKASSKFSILGLLLFLLPLAGYGALGKQNNLLGKFYVSSITGTVTCVSDGRILELKKGDTILARGAIVETSPDAHATLVFSNQTGVYVDEKTRLEVEKFDQEFFAPNNNLRVEPSNSSTIVRLDYGRVLINTPRLLSGTTMVYETAHGAINIKGEKILIEVTEKQTHVAMIAGNASVNPRDAEGRFVSLGKRLVTGQEAFVKKTLGSEDEEAPPSLADAARKQAKPAVDVAAKTPDEAAASGVVAESLATVVKITGVAHVILSEGAPETELNEGTQLPKGAVISTDGSSEVHLQPFEGTVAILKPNTSLQIEKISRTVSGGVTQKQTTLLALKAGTVISMIDPALQSVNDYGIRTPNGIANAKGTSFAVSIEEGIVNIATTADTVSLQTPEGATYEIKAGFVVITPPGGVAQPPVSFTQAVSENAGFSGLVGNSLNAVVDVVQNNIGNLTPEAATNLLSKVAAAAAAALPAEAPAIAAKVVFAVNAPSSSTAGSSAESSAAVIGAVTAAVPSSAVQIAVASAAAAPSQRLNIAASTTKEAPTQAAAIASALAETFIVKDAQGMVTSDSIQNVAALASAVTSSSPSQAAPVASAIMQALAVAVSQSAELNGPQGPAAIASTIAIAVTTAAPNQAVPVASTVMQSLTANSLTGASTETIAQTAATLASAVTTVVPPQAQEVATAVMQLLIESSPAATSGAIANAAGLMAAAVGQAAPGETAGINDGLAGLTNQTSAQVASTAQSLAAEASAITTVVAQSNAAAAIATTAGNASASVVTSGTLLAQGNGTGGSSGGTTGSGSNSSGSGGGGSTGGGSTAGSGDTASAGGTTGGGSTSGGDVAANSSSSGGTTGDSAASGDGGTTGGNGTTSGGDVAGAGELANALGTGSGDGTGSSGGGTSDNATSIIINQFDPSSVDGLAEFDSGTGSDGVQFDTGPDSDGTTTVFPNPTIPSKLPNDPVSSANIGQ